MLSINRIIRFIHQVLLQSKPGAVAVMDYLAELCLRHL